MHMVLYFAFLYLDYQLLVNHVIHLLTHSAVLFSKNLTIDTP